MGTSIWQAGPIQEQPLEVPSGGLLLPAVAYLPSRSRGRMVLVHGLPSTAPTEPGDDGYPGLARRFAAAGWASVWVGMRAAGAAPGFFSIRGWVADVRAAVEAAGDVLGDAGPLAVMGSSAGGAVSVQALGEGAPADALVLLATPAEWVSFGLTPEDGLRRIIEGSGMAVSPDVAADPRAWAEEFREVTPESSIGGLGVPVLIVHGSDDQVVPIAHAHRLARRARNAELVVLEGASHRLRTRPEVVPLVVEWLAKVLG